MKGWIDVEVRDRDGRVIQKGRHEMHSLLNNFLRIILGHYTAPGGTALETSGLIASTTVILPTGSTDTAYIEWYAGMATHGGGAAICVVPSAGDGSYGIILGTSSDTVALDQYELGGRISQGTGAGQLDYRESLVDDLGLDTGVSPPVYRFRIRRSIINSSASGVTFSEVGLYARNVWNDILDIRLDVKYLIGRDVLSTPYTIPAGGSATVAVTVEVVLG